MALKDKDFIEVEFTAKLKNGGIFDSNIKEDLDKAGIQGLPKPFIFCIGEGMFVKGVDKFLIGKEIGEYNISLTPKEAFGPRNAKLIQMIPKKVFAQHRINPIPGSTFDFDGKLARVLTVSGGRVMVDFNNPIAGKEVEYFVKILRKVDDKNEQIGAINEFFFRQSWEFEIKDTQKETSKKLILKVPKGASQFAILFKDKYKELFNLDLECEEVEEKKG